MKSQAQLHDDLEKSGWWNPFAEYDVEQPAEKVIDVLEQEYYRRQILQPERGHNPRKSTPEFMAGKKAYYRGVDRNQNPYSPGRLPAELWFEGWDAALKCERANPEVAARMKRRYRKGTK